jgi:acetyl-CoA C-acetyltransferase
LKRAKLKEADVDQVIMGNVLSAGLGQAPARQAALGAGLPKTVECLTVNKVCGSGLKAVMLAAQAIRLGEAEVVIAGGMESMTNAPYLLPKARDGYRMGHGALVDSMIKDGLWDVYNDFHMGAAAELCAKKFAISRQEQDEFAAGSYERAQAAQRNGNFGKEIVSVVTAVRNRQELVVTEDEEVGKFDLKKMKSLRPAFREDGTVTAGNAQAITALLKQRGDSLTDVDLFEINEAFAVASIAVNRELGLNPERVNVRGGAIALGHPIGASGARILTTLIHSMNDLGKRQGIAALCIGGGEAVAMMVERSD